jgi:hypothetical protein
MAHNISGWEPQLEQTHVHFICHLLCGFWEKKHEYVHVVYKMLLINRAPFSAYDITTLHKHNIANKVQLPLFFPLFHFYHNDSKA